MLLVVGDDHVLTDHVRALEREFPVATVPSPERARERCHRERYEAVIVDRPLVDAATAWFVRDLQRSEIGSERVPVVAVLEGAKPCVAVDETVRTPIDGETLVTAVRRAVRLVEYEDAVDQFFDACRRSFGPRSRDPGEARERADECLRALDACDGRLPFDRLIDA